MVLTCLDYRICHLLELWIRDYPYDFAVRGTAGALSALIKSIISKTYLLHYGSDFLPFLELLPSLVDKDSDWALKFDDSADESDDSYSLLEAEEKSAVPSPKPKTTSTATANEKARSAIVRERKGSLPLTAKALLPTVDDFSAFEHTPDTPKQQLRELQRLAAEVNNTDPEELAKEITRLEAKLFLDIQVIKFMILDMYRSLISRGSHDTGFTTRLCLAEKTKKRTPLLGSTMFPTTWRIGALMFSRHTPTHIRIRVVSLILCHDKPRMRAKQIEKLVEVAQKLRSLNNYSALRAFVAGINNSSYPGDQTMEQFKARCPEQAKNLQSWDVLLQHIRSHRAYRLALRNTKGACIPALYDFLSFS